MWRDANEPHCLCPVREWRGRASTNEARTAPIAIGGCTTRHGTQCVPERTATRHGTAAKNGCRTDAMPFATTNERKRRPVQSIDSVFVPCVALRCVAHLLTRKPHEMSIEFPDGRTRPVMILRGTVVTLPSSDATPTSGEQVTHSLGYQARVVF